MSRILKQRNTFSFSPEKDQRIKTMTSLSFSPDDPLPNLDDLVWVLWTAKLIGDKQKLFKTMCTFRLLTAVLNIYSLHQLTYMVGGSCVRTTCLNKSWLRFCFPLCSFVSTTSCLFFSLLWRRAFVTKKTFVWFLNTYPKEENLPNYFNCRCLPWTENDL